MSNLKDMVYRAFKQELDVPAQSDKTKKFKLYDVQYASTEVDNGLDIFQHNLFITYDNKNITLNLSKIPGQSGEFSARCISQKNIDVNSDFKLYVKKNTNVPDIIKYEVIIEISTAPNTSYKIFSHLDVLSGRIGDVQLAETNESGTKINIETMLTKANAASAWNMSIDGNGDLVFKHS